MQEFPSQQPAEQRRPRALLTAPLLKFYSSQVNHPWRWLAGWACFVAALMGLLTVKTDGLQNITYYNGPYLYFTENNPDFRALTAMEATYAADTSLIFLIRSADQDLFNPQSLKAIEELTDAAWKLPFVLRVDSLANFQHTQVTGDDLETDYLYQHAGSLTPNAIGQIRQIALNEPSLLRQSISADGTTATVVARVNLDEAQTRALELMPHAEALAREFRERYPDLTFQLLGDAPNAAASDQATQQTFRQTTPIAMTLVLLCLFFILRNLWSVLACQLVIGLSIALGYCLFFLLDFSLSPISAGASPIILTLAVADAIHLLISYQKHYAKSRRQKAAMLESLRINFAPVWLTSITTGVGFLFMNFAESPPFHDLGNAVFLGVLMAFLLSTSLLPALMMVLPPPAANAGSRQTGWIRAMGRFTVARHKSLLATTGSVIVILSACIPLNHINDFMLEYYDDTFPVRRAVDSYLQHMGGLQRLQYAVPAGKPGGITDAEYLNHLDELVNFAEADPRVSHVRSFTQVIKRLNRNMHEGDQSYYRIPDDSTLISQYLLLYEMGLPFGLGLDTQMDINKSETKLEIVFHRMESEQLVAAREDMQRWIGSHWPDYMQTRATGMDSLFGDVTFENVKSMIAGTLLALATVSLLLIFTLGSVRYGLLSLIPNLLPAAMTFGLWGIIDGEVGIVVSVITCMTLGIIVDDTVHFLSKYVRARKEMGMDSRQAALYGFETVGVALIATSVILIANFSVMAFSHYYPNAATGILTSITIAFALLIDFFFFVPLLLLLDRAHATRPAVARAAVGLEPN